MPASADPARNRATPRPSGDGAECAHHLFEARAAHAPCAPAVAHAGRTLSFAGLDRRASAVAARLRALGVGPEARVAVLLERGPELAAALLGVLKAGGAYVPLDPEYPAERIAYVLEDSGAVAVLTDAVDALPPASPRGVDVASILDAEGDGFEPVAVDPDGLAYVIYTSGSTGRPKGVGVTHRSLVSHNRAAAALFGLTPADSVAQIASIGFDISVEEIFPTWAAGGTVVFRPAEVPGFGAGFLRWIAHEGITVLNLPTAFWHAWVADLASAGAAPPPSLRLVVVGGERARPAALAEWHRLAGGRVRWINSYGPTEATVTATAWEPAGESAGEVPIGAAIANTRAYVLDGAMRPVAGGEAGELFLGGEGVARGYLGRPALTAERFVPDAFGGAPGARLYRTGDRVRDQGAGVLEFLGRLDDQVKVGGFRVEPGEVEAVLATHPAVAHAAVVAREDGTGRTRLVGYAVPREGARVDTAEVRRWLRARLPAYMVPSALVALDALPLSEHGKVDRRALPTPELEPPDPAPGEGGDTARALAEIFREVLGAPRVGPGDDFFELGGHSLLAMQALSRVRQRWGVELPVRVVFEAPGVAALAARVDAARAEPAAPRPPLRPVRRDGELPLSFAQQRLWFLHRLEPESAFYNIPTAVRLTGALDAAALRRALGEIVHRHEALRTVFLPTPDGSAQVVHPAPRAFPLPVHDLAGLERPRADAEAMRIARAEAEAPFDLTRDLMLRGVLVRVRPDEHLLVLDLHHVAGDGWSLGVLFGELAALYAAFSRGEPSPLAPPRVQYGDFAVWQREWLRGEVLERQLAYWRAALAGAPAELRLASDRPRPPVQSYRGEVHRFHLDAATADAVRRLARAEGATLYMVLLAAYDALLHRWSGETDLVVGSPVAGRVSEEVEGLVGFFVNTMAVRVDVAGDPTFRELVGRARRAALDAFAHQDLPFERVVEELRPERTLSRAPLFQVSLILQNTPARPVALPRLTLAPEPVDSGTAKFDLSVELTETAGGLDGQAEFAADLFDPATVARMMAQLAALLAAAARAPGTRLSRLVAALPDPARERVLVEWNRTARPAPRGPVHRMVAAHAAAAPGAPALVDGGRVITYGEVDAAANRLAHALRARGVGPEARVGVAADRTPAMVVSVLAVLKAGGACVLLDPAYPAERLRWMLADSGARLVVAPRADTLAVPAGVEVLALDAAAAEVAARPAGEPEGEAGPGALAFVIYTSGSTGRPKGAINAHRGVLNRLRWMQAEYALAPEDAVLQKTTFSFDVSVWELFWPLRTGARLVLARPGGHRD
ncbi:MAG TPA: amino acid adenylation domain-containing protein, partial [Longimicrobium sp.]|nr:amino acid adenylation domain-containing protein [Longimicrobium sp.]